MKAGSKSGVLKTAHTVLFSSRGIRALIFWFLLTFLFIFIVAEIDLVTDVLSGTFPVDVFLTIVPSIFYSFLVSSGLSYIAHIVFICILVAIYITTLFFIFFDKKVVPLSSIPTSVFGLIGITVGSVCVACGGTIVLLLFSGLGFAASSTLFYVLDSQIILFVTEALLMVSILLLFVFIQKIYRPS